MIRQEVPDATLDDLRGHFLARARSDSVSILELCAGAAHAPRLDRMARLDEACCLLHRLSGTAGTFGLAEFGGEARELHLLAKSMAAEPGSDFAERLIGLSDGVREMARSLDAVLPAHEGGDHGGNVWDVDQAAKSAVLCVLGFDERTTARICQAFEGFGYATQTVTSVAEVAALLAIDKVVGVLVHLEHEIDAQLAALNRLRAMQESPAPVLAVCTRSDFSDYLAAARGGIDGYFVEPGDLPRIEARLAFLIENRRRQSTRVLLVDDDLDLLAAYKHILRADGMVVATSDKPGGVIELLAEFRPDVVLLDIEMPECTGPELAQVIRLHEEWMHVPILYMSAQSEGADKLLATRKAGEAFLSKPIDPRELVASICAHGRNARQMIETAARDTLTGLLKTSFINEMLDAELERAYRHGCSTCIAMIDLDNFKAVNDTHGHPVGDLVIRTLAGVLRQRLRVIDGVGRVGGEEFLVVLSDCTIEKACAVIEAMRERFAEIEFDGFSSRFRSSFSAGLAETVPGGSTRVELIALADRALYAAKSAGRNRSRVAPAVA